ncbi:MAG: TlyA family rRNA (cytidine-2'-O)-methyltransferase [Actinobacteria bacterium]|uniref:Unannotated protein n=1 Tax=freshwater metagenome TaxID=449393 RepID=A0A6J7CZP3_9ZZZZ|nr:TlyA family rRNA (cytidine-2'-O)-methyltransferase [Actinomycetota bacterium]
MTRRRLDAELTRRGLARSRDQAQELIAAGAVHVRGVAATKAATQVETSSAITVENAGHGYVSRGALKLIGALDAFEGLLVDGRDALDAGASTGGFTQVLLERGVSRVLCVDVGYGQLAWVLREDPRVTVRERTNVRTMSAADVPFLASVVVADLSFISLKVVLPALLASTAPVCDYVLMVKPQFEAGRDRVGDGVIRDPEIRFSTVESVALHAVALGLTIRGVEASPLPGPSGNVEYFLWMDRGREGGGVASVGEAILRAVSEGPT